MTLNRIADRTLCGVFDFYVDDGIEVSFWEEFVDDPSGEVRHPVRFTLTSYPAMIIADLIVPIDSVLSTTPGLTRHRE